MDPRVLIHTIGHSNHSIAAFLELLAGQSVTLVVDVRSQPYSQWAPQFNQEILVQSLEEAGVGYRFMGDELGGRPSAPALYTAGRADYQRMEKTDTYQRGIARLEELAGRERLAIMCSEAEYQECHRHLLITQSLLKRGARVLHIKPDGRTVQAERIPEQLSLF